MYKTNSSEKKGLMDFVQHHITKKQSIMPFGVEGCSFCFCFKLFYKTKKTFCKEIAEKLMKL